MSVRMRRLRNGRPAFTLLETCIALALSSLIIIVIFNMMVNSRMHVEKDLQTLEFLGKSTILLEYVKRDIRNAGRKANAVNAGEDTLSILSTDAGGKEQEIKYKYFREGRYVGRKVDDGKAMWFGRDGKTGIITDFSVRAVDNENFRGFYQVYVAFMTRYESERQRLRGEDPKPKKVHTFQALVNRRTPDDVDDKWNAGFRTR